MRHIAMPHPNAACCVAIFCSVAAFVMLAGLLLAAIAE
jgi:hypothetical protein